MADEVDEDDDNLLDLSLPLVYNVLIPSQADRRFGRESTSGPLACFIAYRGNKNERNEIAYAAALCGVSASTFMRHIVMSVVTDIMAFQAAKEEEETSPDPKT